MKRQIRTAEANGMEKKWKTMTNEMKRKEISDWKTCDDEYHDESQVKIIHEKNLWLEDKRNRKFNQSWQ